MVTYAVTASVSVTAMFEAGWIPGIMLIIGLCIGNMFWYKHCDSVDKTKYPVKVYVDRFVKAILALLMPVIILIFIETDTELTGIGEAATFGSSMDAMEFVVEKQLKSLLLDEDPTKIEFLHQKMMWNNWANGRQGMVMGAISGIDVALWDILGKVANLLCASCLDR